MTPPARLVLLHPLRRGLGLVCLIFMGLLGCEDEKPATPFQVATALPRQEAPPDRAADRPAGPAIARVALLAPRNAARWEVFDRTLSAPAGTVFASAIASSAGTPDELLVLLTPAEPPSGEAAGLWLVNRAGQWIQKLLKHPAFLPTGEDCRLHTHLQATGEQTTTVFYQARCDTRLLPGTTTRFFAVVAPTASQPVLMDLRSVEPSPGEDLTYQVDSTDIDGDGADDVRLTVTLAAPDGTKEMLPLVWLARTAGASRRADEPLASLAKRVARLSIGAVRKAEREEVPSQVSALRRLLSSLCGELGTPHLTRTNGDALHCGDLTPHLFQLSHAEVQAQLGRGQLGRALGAAERAGWFGTKPNPKQTDTLRKLLLAKIPHHKAKQRARFDVAAASFPTAYASPLRFDQNGLWLRGADGKTKRLTLRGDPPLTPTEGHPLPQTVTPPVWDLQPSGPGEKRLSAALPSCQRSEVQLAFTRPTGPPLPPLPVALLSPRPGNCRTFAGVSLHPEPLEWATDHLSFVLGGELLQSSGHPRPPSRPFAFGTEFGLAVQRGTQLSLWTDTSGGLHHCTVSQQADKIACLKGTSVFVYGPNDGT